jgi:WD40 repeat protein/serine/threonine protein kinase
MGVVFMAEQTEPVRRKVALKIIKLGMDTKSVVARFEAERQALALMDHPNIAKVLDAGSTETGRPYFVMELVKGVPIHTYCDKNHLSTRERLELFIQVCKSIQHAHQKGVIHRDIKPGNILVTLHDGKPVPKVIDFGIAKATNQRLTEKTLFTHFAHMIGTPAYMSPEQAEMSGLDVDTRSDVYSLGVLLYELLTGTTPFPEKELLSKGYGEMQRIIAEQEPERPSLRMSTLVGEQQTIVAKNRSGEWGNLTKQLRGDLDWIVLKTLEKDRTRRYETANGLAEDIRRHLSDEPVLAAKPSFSYQLAKLYYRHKPTFAAVAGIAIALVIGTVVSTAQAISAQNARDSEAHQKVLAEEKRKEAEEAKATADDQRQQAEQNELEARRLLYAADMRDVGRALDDEEFGQAKRLMQRQASQKNLQGWEWRHLWLKTQGGKRQQLSMFHGGNGHSLSFSPDGKWFADGSASVGGQDALCVWNLESGQRLNSAPEVKYGRVRLAFSPVSNLLAYNSQDTSEGKVTRMHLWDADTQESVASFTLQGTCEGLAFSSDGKVLILANQLPDDASCIVQWDIEQKKTINTVQAPGMNVFFSRWESFAIDRQARTAIYAAQDFVQTVDLRTGELLKKLPADGNINGVAISPDGRIAVVASAIQHDFTRGPVLWDLSTGQKLSTLLGHVDSVSEIVFWPDGKTIATASLDQSIRLWDISDPRSPGMIRILRGHESWVTQLALAPDQKTLISSGGGDLFIWNLNQDGVVPDELEIKDVTGSGFAFSQDGEILVTIEGTQVVRRKGPAYQEQETLFQIEEPARQRSKAFSPDARFLAIGSSDGFVTLWDVPNRQSVRRKVGEKRVRIIHVKNDGVVAIEAERSDGFRVKQFEFHDLRHSKILSSTTLYHGMHAFAAYSPDENVFVRTNGSSDLGALIHDRQRNRDEILNTEWKVATHASFSPDGKLLAIRSHAGRTSGAVYVYDAKTYEEKSVFTSRTAVSNWGLLAFSPDSRRFVTGGMNRHGLQLWDVETGQPVLSLGTEYSDFHYAAFSPDGQWLGCTTEAGLKLWRAPSWEEIEEARTLAMK